jgi:predicted GTPase
MATWPAGIYTPLVRGTNLDDAVTHTDVHDGDVAEVVALEQSLGVGVKGAFASVAARLDDVDDIKLCISTVAAFAIPTGVGSFTAVQFDTDVLDPDGWHNTGSQTERFIPNVAATYYEVTAGVAFGNNLADADRAAVAILVNGTGVTGLRTDIAAASASSLQPTIQVTGIVGLTLAADYISVGVLHSNASSRNVAARISVKRVK